MKIDAQIKRLFFDSERVQRSVDRATRKNLSLYGRDTRQAARRSIKRKRPTKRQRENLQHADERKRNRARMAIAKKRRVVSQPGQPPFSKDPQDKIRKILYYYNPKTKGVIVGIVKLAGVRGDHVPNTLEYGGATTRSIFDRDRGRRVYRTVNVRARPSIRPAGRKSLPKLMRRLKGSVK